MYKKNPGSVNVKLIQTLAFFFFIFLAVNSTATFRRARGVSRGFGIPFGRRWIYENTAYESYVPRLPSGGRPRFQGLLAVFTQIKQTKILWPYFLLHPQAWLAVESEMRFACWLWQSSQEACCWWVAWESLCPRQNDPPHHFTLKKNHETMSSTCCKCSSTYTKLHHHDLRSCLAVDGNLVVFPKTKAIRSAVKLGCDSLMYFPGCLLRNMFKFKRRERARRATAPIASCLPTATAVISIIVMGAWECNYAVIF